VAQRACLPQYEAAFRDNAIDAEVLPKLTVDDLKELGVAIVGHRRKIISAIEELLRRSNPGAASHGAETGRPRHRGPWIASLRSQ
jgi:hypothetical protein